MLTLYFGAPKTLRISLRIFIRAYDLTILCYAVVFRSVRESVVARGRQKGGEAQEHGFQMQFEPGF